MFFFFILIRTKLQYILRRPFEIRQVGRARTRDRDLEIPRVKHKSYFRQRNLITLGTTPKTNISLPHLGCNKKHMYNISKND